MSPRVSPDPSSVLMIAFHYPPFGEGSGVHRTAKFARYLRDFGWRPLILTTTASAYPEVRDARPDDAGTDILVTRARAWDTARQLSVQGRYIRWMALPDRWMTWWPGAVASGLRLVRKFKPRAIWSTYPIATAHLIGLSLHRLTGLPWVADFRDPMTDTDPLTGVEFPLDPSVRRVNGWIERLVVRHCDRAVVTTPGTLRLYADRYSELPPSRWRLIENGYDEEDFVAVERTLNGASRGDRPARIVHSGGMPPSIRNPSAFFAALVELRRAGKIAPGSLQVVLRASGHEAAYRQMVHDAGLDGLVTFEPGIPYRDALIEMIEADGLLVFQDANCNSQIPAKIYEYLRARRPIFALTDAEGDTAGVLRSEGVDAIVPLDDKDRIAKRFHEFLDRLRTGNGGRLAGRPSLERYSRRAQTRELAQLLDGVTTARRDANSRNSTARRQAALGGGGDE